MWFFDILKAIVFGIVEGITEWLPVSSTGHIILLDSIMPLKHGASFYELFEILIQLGAIMAVIVLFFHKLNPFSPKKTPEQKKSTWDLWFKVVVAVLPSAVIGILVDDPLDSFLKRTQILGTNLNTMVVAAMLILYGVVFIYLERDRRKFRIKSVNEIDYRTALMIGAFQCLSIIPGTSRSGATILGALLLGVSRPAGAEFSFFLAIPTMLGASALKLLSFDGSMTGSEIMVLAVACIVSFVVSLLAIRKLMDYVRKHSFAVFGVYRIILGIVVIGYFFLRYIF